MKYYNYLFAVMLLAFGSLTITSCGSDGDGDEMMETDDPILSGISGDWVFEKTAGALAVGPAEGSADWWFNTEEDVAGRACLFDDTWTFNTNGKLTIDLGSSTWIETWQGSDEEGCGAPVAPHTGGEFDFAVSTVNGDTNITLTGMGAFIGLPKAFNGGELSDGTSTEPDSRVYKILELKSESPKRLKLGIAVAGEGNWTFVLAEK